MHWGFVLLIPLLQCARCLALEHTQSFPNSIEHTQSFPNSIRAIHPNSEGLTVTSFRYNPTHTLNEWFASIFGNNSVWYNVSQESPSWMSGPSQLGVAKMEELRAHGNRLIRERLQNIPDFKKKPPPCSIEILGYGRVDNVPPMQRHWRNLGPVAGLATLTWARKDHHSASASASGAGAGAGAGSGAASSASSPALPPTATTQGVVSVKCYWRALFENWRKQNAWTAPNFWAMVFFCPLGVHAGPHSSVDHVHATAPKSAGLGAAKVGVDGRRRLQEEAGAGGGGSHRLHHGGGGGGGQMQCLHLEKSHVSDGDGGVAHFNLTVQLLTTRWHTTFEGRLYPLHSPTANVMHTRHRAEAHPSTRHEKRIHKYSGGGGARVRRRLEGGASKTIASSSSSSSSSASASASASASSSSSAPEKPPAGSESESNAPNIYLTEAQHQQDLQSHQTAVCAVVPYSSNDKAKARANGQMLLEWVWYYAKLGFRVFVYDRDGRNYAAVHDDKLRRALFGATYDEDPATNPLQYLHYHNFTVRGLLDTARSGMVYDNTERKPGAGWGETSNTNTLRARYESQGHDKVNTFTHCRFEAKALYGVERVLAVDFDEFIYCPSAPPNPKAMRVRPAKEQERFKSPSADGPLTATARDLGRYINTVTATLQEAGLRQIMFQQRVTMNKTASPRDCLVDMSSRSPPRSLFNCYGSYRYERASHSIKSFHLGTTCPLTGYHQACPSPQVPRAYDCACPNFDSGAKAKEWPYTVPPLASSVRCTLLHLASNQDTFDDPHERHHDLSPEEAKRMINEPNELQRVAYDGRDV